MEDVAEMQITLKLKINVKKQWSQIGIVIKVRYILLKGNPNRIEFDIKQIINDDILYTRFIMNEYTALMTLSKSVCSGYETFIFVANFGQNHHSDRYKLFSGGDISKDRI